MEGEHLPYPFFKKTIFNNPVIIRAINIMYLYLARNLYVIGHLRFLSCRRFCFFLLCAVLFIFFFLLCFCCVVLCVFEWCFM